jgi:hypothetical protein
VAAEAAGGVDLRDGVDDAFMYGRSLGRQDAAQGGDFTDSKRYGAFRLAGALRGEKSQRHQRTECDVPWNLQW